MDYLEWQWARFAGGSAAPGVIWRDREHTYAELAARWEQWRGELDAAGIAPGSPVAVVGDYSPASITCLLALAERRCILVPLSRESRNQHDSFFPIAEIGWRIALDAGDRAEITATGVPSSHPLLEQLRARQEAGLVLFSSGSTGRPKAILHALGSLLEKFRKPRHCYRTLSFLLFDHIGGVNTLLYTMANLGSIVVPEDRSVAAVCRAVGRHRAELLPTSPSFLNLLLLAEAHKTHDLSSLKLITYGTEVMPERTLQLAGAAFPGATLQQTYGLSEVGILRSKSAGNNSLLVKVGGEDYETKVVNGTLRVRARTSMLGYLNAPSPFDAEGWLDTGDAVIQEGDYYRILGRESEIINVGGQKVYPAEVEKVIAEIPGVIDVAVIGEEHLLLGQIVTATVQMETVSPAAEMKKRIVAAAQGRLQPYMIPSKVRVVTEPVVNARFKKVRR